MSCGTVLLDVHSYIVGRYRNSGKNQLFLVETNDKWPFKMIVIYSTRVIKWQLWFRRFSAKDAQTHFKFATLIDKRCSNLNPWINENYPNVPKVRFLLVTLTYILNPLASNDHCTGWYFTTPKCRMTSTLITSGKVEKRVFSEAKGRSDVFQILSIQCLVFCCFFLTRMRDEMIFEKPSRKNCAVVGAILQRLSRGKEAFEGAKFGYRLRDIHVTANGIRITAHACCHPQNPSWGRVLLWNYFLSVLANILKSVQEVPRILHRLSSQIPIDSVVI